MISKISKIIGVGKFNAISQDSAFRYGEKGQNCNIVFGFNGTGKTTISNALAFFADNSFISEEEKSEIFDDLKSSENAAVKIKLDDGNECAYPSPNRPHSKSIYVFNANFVAAHVFDGTKGTLRKFSNISGEIGSKEIGAMGETIDQLSVERALLQRENDRIDTAQDEIRKRRSASFAKTLTDKNKRLMSQPLNGVSVPSEGIAVLEDRLVSLSADYELSKKQPELKADLAELEAVSFAPIKIDVATVGGLLSKGIQQLSKEALEKRIAAIQQQFSDEKHRESVERWFKFGKSILENAKAAQHAHCPVCDTDLSGRIDSVLTDYDGYFDQTYEAFLEDLSRARSGVAECLRLVEEAETGAKKLDDLHKKYLHLVGGVVCPKFDFSEIRSGLSGLKDLLEKKNDSVQKTFLVPTALSETTEKLHSAMASFDSVKSKIVEAVSSKKLDTHQIETQIRKVYGDIVLVEVDKLDGEGALKKYKDRVARIGTIDKSATEGLPYWKTKLREELKKIKAESKGIGKYLGRMGIDHFDVDINDDKDESNIIIRYKSSERERNRLKNCLSDGEKTALAFAYFLSKFENEISGSGKMTKAVVVIDDPISSLDENRLYSTANLIRQNFANVRQLVVLSHNFLFLKFFHSFYKSRVSCFFLDDGKLTDLPEELSNFETPYFYMLRRILDFVDQEGGLVKYADAKKYLPNYIRRVLETFLSFKFCKVSDRTRGYRSPGLTDFDESIDAIHFPEEDKVALKERIAEISQISDAHSHGNAHHTQENFYISETELIKMAESAMFVIDTMDGIHGANVASKPVAAVGK